ncbi:uncharacterized protein LOC131659013 [Vicia villosa]|uniref:uncharacterized protein LOC131659013 n=1 Tax=Vicia villosa TaxID=3911 RepID=UPI00273CC002|nr:uncharacterized protein LOC131659013 [Vicia villosa]
MIIVTHNIRGWGNIIKRKHIGFMNQSSRVDVCFLQETKLSTFNLKTAEDFWGAKDVDWTHKDSNGALGGSVILWWKNSLDPIQSFRGVGFVGMKALCKVFRREVWKSLLRLKRLSVGEEWCIGGDFNTVLFKEKRIGKSVGCNGRDISGFYNFGEEMELIDLPCLDNQMVGKKIYSDHFPVWLKSAGGD